MGPKLLKGATTKRFYPPRSGFGTKSLLETTPNGTTESIDQILVIFSDDFRRSELEPSQLGGLPFRHAAKTTAHKPRHSLLPSFIPPPKVPSRPGVGPRRFFLFWIPNLHTITVQPSSIFDSDFFCQKFWYVFLTEPSIPIFYFAFLPSSDHTPPPAPPRVGPGKARGDTRPVVPTQTVQDQGTGRVLVVGRGSLSDRQIAVLGWGTAFL
jgi:hypothetical protein